MFGYKLWARAGFGVAMFDWLIRVPNGHDVIPSPLGSCDLYRDSNLKGHINPASTSSIILSRSTSHLGFPSIAKKAINSFCPNMSGIYSPSLNRISRERLGALLLTGPTEQAVVVVDVRDSGGTLLLDFFFFQFIECWLVGFVFLKTTSEVI